MKLNQPKKMKPIESIREALGNLDPSSLLCDLPDNEFITGGAITNACRAARYDESGRVTVNDLNAWGMTVAEFQDLLEEEIEA